VDLGASKVAFALGDAAGRVRARWRRPTGPCGDPARDVARLLDDARAFLAEQGVAAAELRAVGVAAPGPLDRARGALLAPPNLPGWDDVPLRDALADGLGAPVQLENDASAAALAEWRFGAGRGFQDLVYLSMSTGVGGGLVLGGRLHTGVSGNAGEWGHVPVEWEGEPCACGRRGCLEAYAGGAAWTRRLRAEVPRDSRALALAGAREAVAPEHVIAAAREGDAFARAELERWNAYLARAVELVVQALAPEVVVLGTIAAAAGELCLAPVRARVAARVWPVLGRGLHVVAAGLGEELPYRTGLCVALQASGGT
jgi:glucokinase